MLKGKDIGMFEALFRPLSIGSVWIKNRIAMAPMGLVGMVDHDGSLNRRIIRYYVERAKGGVGLIITGLTRVENEIERLMLSNRHVLPILDSPKYIPSHSQLTEEVHHYGARIFVQLTAGTGRVAPTLALLQGMQPVAPSEVPCYWIPTIKTRALTKEEIKKLIKAFGNAAEIAYIAGYDGIELHGHEGYLLDQFTHSVWNRRTDEYGGSLENRLRIVFEILHEIKDRVGKNFPVVYRFGLKHFIKGYNNPGLPGEDFKEVGRDINEGLEMAKLLEKEGFDALHVDAGCYDSWFMAHPPEYLPHGCLAEFAAMVKKVVRIPVIAVGRLDDPYVAAKIISENKADMIAIGRGLLADPYWPLKVMEGRLEDIRPCIGCHECLYRIIELGRTLACAVNAQTGRELEMELKPLASEPKRIVVVGGGVAGMEFARVAGLRGHKVILYEKHSELGGHLIELETYKPDIGRLRKYYIHQLKKLENKGRVELRLRIRASVKEVLNENPDVIIIATGSIPAIPPIEGVNQENVYTAIDVLRGKAQLGEKVCIIGAGLTGIEMGIMLSEKGKDVSIIEMLPAPNISASHANVLYLMTKIKQLGVKLYLNTRVERIEKSKIIGRTPKGIQEFSCDSVVLATGLKPVRDLYYELQKHHPSVHLIGDALSPRKIRDAIWDAYFLANTI